MIIFTFDLETQNHRKNKRLAAPFDERNYIVQIGYNVNGGKVHEQYYTEPHRKHVLPKAILDSMGKGDVINGFNIKFDLLWVWTEPCLKAALKRGVKIYDGQYAEYLMGGMVQEVQMTSMNAIAEAYGGGCKVDAVKEMWEDGVLTADIPRDLLTDYLCGDDEEIVGDVMNTWLIMKGQIKRMREELTPEFRRMIQFRFDGLLATTEMEFNGMYVNQVVAEKNRDSLVLDLATAKKTLHEFIPELPEELEFNWNSTQHKSCLIFGGTVKYKKWTPNPVNGLVVYVQKTDKHPLFTYGGETLPVDTVHCKLAGIIWIMEVPKGTIRSFEYKGTYYITQDTFLSGKNKGKGKFKNVKTDDLDKPKGSLKDHFFTFKGYTKPEKKWQGAATDARDKPLYSTAEEVIDTLEHRGLPFTNALTRHAKVNKELGTYYWQEDAKGVRKGMLTLVGDDSIIHHKLNHTSTVTSRMSSSDPNLQNIPRKGDVRKVNKHVSRVKQSFTSRFGELGKLAEIDYSQLEVVVQGVLTQDPQLCQDLRDRIDFHCKRLSAKLGEDYDYVWGKCHTDDDQTYGQMRTGAKIFSFQRAYGAGVHTVVESTGMSKSDVEGLIAAENRLYPNIQRFDDKLNSTINANRSINGRKIFHNGIAFNQGESFWDSPTGTRYVWREGITPDFMHDKGKYTGFSPTERKNYPMQGFGGEIMQTMLGVVFRYFLENDNFDGDVLLVNTVHDCVLLDGVEDKIEAVAREVQRILETVPEVFNKAYPKLNITVPFPVETEIGRDLFDMTVLH